ncbi:fungal Zn(2)-Cys(6) binuclear cluster domain family protein [Aspergillus niger]|nr:fungal Zn(2)-Cys(6) binuclear cluster domain family protein [Aspergillus niger]
MSGISGPLILVSTVTPDNYARAIISLSRRYSSTSAFPGNNYVDIAEWMIQERYLLNSVKQEKDAISSPFWSEKPHDLVVVYNSGERQWDVQQYSQEQHEDFSAATPVPASGSGKIVFIRGFISPSWVSAIGSKYNIEPEFFKRHMDFLSIPLEESPPGPWSSHLKSKATALPILQYHPKMAFRTTSNRLDPDANVTAEVQQSTTILPLQYDSLIALVDLARRAPQDPLSMCIPLFAHAAFSEVQFLNLMESRIQKQVNSIVEGLSTDALGTLQYFSNILNRHAQQLKDSTRALFKLTERSSQGLDGTRVEKQIAKNAGPLGLDIGSCRQISGTEMVKNVRSSSSDGTFTSEGLLEDYEQLYARCMELSDLCTQGISLAMNKATIDESRRAIEQSERVKKLTLLATLFIPLSFSSSLLGMNIDLLGQNSVQSWWFLVLCIPITLFAYIFYLWDSQALRRCLVRFWKRWCRAKRNVTAAKSWKDPSYIV